MQRTAAILLVAGILCSCGQAPECIEDSDCDQGGSSCQIGSCSKAGECVYSTSTAGACQPQSEPYVDLQPRSDDELPPSPFPRRVLSPGEAYDRPPHDPPPPPGGDGPAASPEPIIPRPEPPSPCGPIAAANGFCG